MKKVLTILILAVVLNLTGCYNTHHEHSYGSWVKKEPCDTKEYRQCTVCLHEEERDAEYQHNIIFSTGICVDCEEKINYTEEELKNILEVNSIYPVSNPQQLKITWTNKSLKTISKILFEIQASGYEPYLKETIYANEYLSSSKSIAPGEEHTGFWDILWASCIKFDKFTSIEIHYTDGSSVYLNEESAKFVR